MQESNKYQEAWKGFTAGSWKEAVDVRDFINKNVNSYDGDENFLTPATSVTKELWDNVMEGIKIENKTLAPLDFDTSIVSSITSHDAGYIDESKEKIVGLQTDKPLKRALVPQGGIRMVQTSCEIYGRELDPKVTEIFTKYRKTHNAGVFDAYTDEIKLCRSSGVLTGLPDAYGRGRIIGDYRRLALYGADYLIANKKAELKEIEDFNFATNELGLTLEQTIQLREELSDQIRSLADIVKMAATYGYDVSGPATDVREAIQWMYFAYLAAIKSQNGAAMSLGRTSTFIDIYAERDLNSGKYSEEEIQEFIDHFIMKLRMIRFLRIPEYDQLFSGDPIWATETLAGMGLDGKHLVTKTSFRYLHTLYNMGPSPEPNMTVLWSTQLPENFKNFCAKVSIETSAIQYENDDLMRPTLNSDDYAIACCVSPMVVGKEMQFFGARANLAKTLLYAINGGVDEIKGVQVAPKIEPVADDYLDYDDVMQRLDNLMDWLAEQYVKALNIIHYMHDKYAYEAGLMAFHDRDVKRYFATGIAGLSVAADSLSAIKYAKVKPVFNDKGFVEDYNIEGDYPKFGNNDDKVDEIAKDLVSRFMSKIRKHKTYRNSFPTQSILTITSNVVYGQKTGNTPDGRRAGTPFGPGANPVHGRDVSGAVASLESVAKLPWDDCQDGCSYTFSIIPEALGKGDDKKVNLVALMDGYFTNNADHEGGQHLNVNVLNREMLIDAQKNPEKYPSLTIRVSGYAVRFNALTEQQQNDVINRTFTDRI